MNHKSIPILIVIGLFALFSPWAIAGNQYLVTTIKVPDAPNTGTSAKAINELGQVAGLIYWYDEFGGLERTSAFIWDSTNGMDELGNLGGQWAEAWDINDSSQVSGEAQDSSGRSHAVIWENSGITDLGIGRANAINNSGQAVGWSGSIASGSPFIWDSTHGMQFPFGPGYTYPWGINDSGQVVGVAHDTTGQGQAFIWDDTDGMQFLDVPATHRGGEARDVNNSGQVVGKAQSPTIGDIPNDIAIIWNNVNNYEVLSSAYFANAHGANDAGQVVGLVDIPGESYSHGFIWDGVNGMRDLNGLVIPFPGLEFIGYAADINNAGQVVATARVNGRSHAVLLTPVIEVEIDIKPQSCPNPLNTKSKGVLPVAILGTGGFDVNGIDVPTVILNGVGPIRSNIEDVATPFNGVSNDDCLDCTENGPDGFADIVLHFKTQEIVAAIDPVSDGDCVTLQLTGELLDGTPFEAMDYILVRSKGGEGPSEKPDECYGGVPKTGQTTSYASGDDGDFQMGVTWPVPRFADNDETVTDNLTGLIWTKNANIYGLTDWSDAIASCSSCDEGGYIDWRLANINELLSLMDYSQNAPALTPGHPFTNVQSAHYWSSTMSAGGGTVWSLYFGGGVGTFVPFNLLYVWCVRGGN